MLKIARFISLALVALLITCSVPVFSAPNPNLPLKKIAQVRQTSNLLEKGLEFYQQGQFTKALAIWQQELQQAQAQGDHLRQILCLRYLSLAHQQLEQWQAAQATIEESLALLKQGKNEHNSSVYLKVTAQVYNTLANWHWHQGDLENAIATWSTAATYYQQLSAPEAVVEVKLNQVQALQMLGLSSSAQQILEELTSYLQRQPPSYLQARILLHLGQIWRRFGQLPKSTQILQESLALAENSDLEPLISLELGNTEQAASERAIAIGKIILGNYHSQEALKWYRRSGEAGFSQQPQAWLNQLSLLNKTGAWSEAESLSQQIDGQLSQLPLTNKGLQMRLNFTNSLICFKQVVEQENLSCVSQGRQKILQRQPSAFKAVKINSWEDISQKINSVKEKVDKIGKLRLKAEANLQIARIYQINQQFSLAQQLIQEAILIAEEIKADDLLYLGQWQLGRLLKQQGKLEQAIAAYTSTVEILDRLQNDLITVKADVPLSFQEQIEQTYRELVDLLLTPETITSTATLEKVIGYIDSLQISELENFLGCYLIPKQTLQQAINVAGEKSALIYPIVLHNRLEIIAKLPGQPWQRHTHQIKQEQLEKIIKDLQKYILRRNASQLRYKSQQLYQWLLAPLGQQLENNPQVENLIFALDSDLRSIPVGVLYDAEQKQYLAQKNYDFSVVPNLALVDWQSSSDKTILAAGISEEMIVGERFFPQLNVQKELNQIESQSSSKTLLNSQFTTPNIQNQLASGDFSVIHLATHGKFSSDPEETFLLAYGVQQGQGKLLNANDLEALIIARPSHPSFSNPLNLLVLSACETASGDQRAPLGLAGLAVKSGASSTLATLWQVSDDSTVEFMEHFYRHWYQPGISKAKAVHLAQQALLDNPRYQNPYYWAPFVLVGNWQ